MFNAKGFCPTHAKKIEKVEIAAETRKKFVREAIFLIYISFWLEEREDTFQINKEYIRKQNKNTFQILIDLSSQNYEMKVLIYEVLQQKLGEFFPELP